MKHYLRIFECIFLKKKGTLIYNPVKPSVHPKEISPEYSLEGLMLKWKLQYFGHLMWRADSFEKTLMLRKIESRRRRGWQSMRWLDGTTDSKGMSLGKLWELVIGRPGVLQSMESQRVGHDWVTELNWKPSLSGNWHWESALRIWNYLTPSQSFNLPTHL